VPATILLVVFPLDLLSGFVFLFTAPLIPLFTVLIGKLADILTRRQWESMSRMNAHFLDVLQGLTTLKLFNRVRGQGHAGLRSKERGNAFVVVRVRADPRFVRDGDDLHTVVSVPMTDAALGATVTAPGIPEDVELEVPPRNAARDRARARGAGDASSPRLTAW
jgi:hypothetical protein